MATLQSNQVLSSYTGTWVPNGAVALVGQYTLTAALAVDDYIEMVKVGRGFVVTGFELLVPDLDSNGSPAITLSLGFGQGASKNIFLDGSTIGQAGGRTDAILIGGILYEFTADDTIDIHVKAGPATGATSGTIKLVVYGTYGARI